MAPVIYGGELQVATFSNFFSLHLSHNSHLQHLASSGKQIEIKKNFQKIVTLKETFQMCNQERECFKNERKATS